MLTQDYLERMDTNTSLGAFDFSPFRVEDTTKLPGCFNTTPITIVNFSKSFGFATVEAENEYLSQRAGFLVENKVRKLVDTVPRTEGDRMKFESVLKALSITSLADIQHMQKFFFNDDEHFNYSCPQSLVDLKSGVICMPDNYGSPDSGKESKKIAAGHWCWREQYPGGRWPARTAGCGRI